MVAPNLFRPIIVSDNDEMKRTHEIPLVWLFDFVYVVVDLALSFRYKMGK
jgi:hypothetical protein